MGGDWRVGDPLAREMASWLVGGRSGGDGVRRARVPGLKIETWGTRRMT
jgi:hypothetical protein